MIEGAMKEVHFSINANGSAKKQALELITLLKESIPIERAQMLIRMEMPVKTGKQFKKESENLVAKVCALQISVLLQL